MYLADIVYVCEQIDGIVEDRLLVIASAELDEW
jgi:hypothetical protein